MIILISFIKTLFFNETIFNEDHIHINYKIHDAEYIKFIKDFEKLDKKDKKSLLLVEYNVDENILVIKNDLLRLMNGIYKCNSINDDLFVDYFYDTYSFISDVKNDLKKKIFKIVKSLKFHLIIYENDTSFIKKIFKLILKGQLNENNHLLSIYKLDIIHRRCMYHFNSKSIYIDKLDILYLIINFVEENIPNLKKSILDFSNRSNHIVKFLDYMHKLKNIITLYFSNILRQNNNETNKNCQFNILEISEIINKKILKLIITLRYKDFIKETSLDNLLMTDSKFSINDFFLEIFENNKLKISKSTFDIFIVFFEDLIKELMDYKTETQDNIFLYKEIMKSFFLNDKEFSKKIYTLNKKFNIGDNEKLINMVKQNTLLSVKFNNFINIVSLGIITEESEYEHMTDEQLNHKIIKTCFERCDNSIEDSKKLLDKRVNAFIDKFTNNLDINSDDSLLNLSEIIFHSYVNANKLRDIYFMKTSSDVFINEILDLIENGK